MSNEYKVREHKWVGPNTGLMDGFCERCGVAYDSNEWEAGCAGPTFYRDPDRYVVIKATDVKNLPRSQRVAVTHMIEAIGALMDGAGVPMRKTLVIEKDWPEFEPAYAMIESRWYREQREKE